MGSEEKRIKREREEKEKLKKQKEEDARKQKELEIQKEKEECSVEELLKIAKKNGWKQILEKHPKELKEMKELYLDSSNGKRIIMKY